ncbi:hypothetical protein F0562_002059 [Nyssa sinensis]|uniref:Endonuclease/exonuclease/phosphatase domain-containing protein n=1 Tax=Nyssa sinensis TaxID=561372 RepID=A0A5J5C4V7_9ASTE|nr:hypothetical protein F0562_002059 [Nyssa sinensis]
MKLISWNCRGLGNPRAIRALRDLVKREAFTLIFLLETKIPARRFDKLKFDLGFPNGIVVDSCGNSGGLAMLWKRGFLVAVQSYSYCHINAVIEEKGVRKWRISGFYSSLDISGRAESWDFLRMLKSRCRLPWLCFRDFNEILSLNEKRGMASTPNWQLRAIREVVNDCGFRDLGFSGFPFIWSNNKVYPNTVLKRLDRFLSTMAEFWLNIDSSEQISLLYSSVRVPVKILIALVRARIEPWHVTSRNRTREAVIRDVENGETNEEAELLRELTREQIVMEIYDVKVGVEGELLGDVTREAVGGEVEDGEVDEVLEVGGDWTGEGVRGEVEGLENGAIGEVREIEPLKERLVRESL